MSRCCQPAEQSPLHRVGGATGERNLVSTGHGDRAACCKRPAALALYKCLNHAVLNDASCLLTGGYGRHLRLGVVAGFWRAGAQSGRFDNPPNVLFTAAGALRERVQQCIAITEGRVGEVLELGNTSFQFQYMPLLHRQIVLKFKNGPS